MMSLSPLNRCLFCTVLFRFVGCERNAEISMVIFEDDATYLVEKLAEPKPLESAGRELTISGSINASGCTVLVSSNRTASIGRVLEGQDPVLIDKSLVMAATWSNTGDALAVLYAPAGGSFREVQLGLYKGECGQPLEQRTTFALPIAVADEGVGLRKNRWTHCISWSRDDALLAVSTVCDRRWRYPEECFFVDLDRQKSFYEPGLSHVCFLGPSRIAAQRPGERFSSIELFDIGVYDENIALYSRGNAASGILKTSWPDSGLFAIWHAWPGLVPDYYKMTGALVLYDVEGRRFASVPGHYNSRIVVSPFAEGALPDERLTKSDSARQAGLSLAAPMIVKYRDENTNARTALEGALR